MSTLDVWYLEPSRVDVDQMRSALLEAGIPVRLVACPDGAQAIMRLEAVLAGRLERPALVILNPVLRSVDGRSVLRFIRGEPRLSDLRVAVLADSEADCRGMHGLRPTCVARKPEAIEELVELVRSWQVLLPIRRRP